MISLWHLSGRIPFFVSREEILGGEQNISVIFAERLAVNTQKRLCADLFLYSTAAPQYDFQPLAERCREIIPDIQLSEKTFEYFGFVKSCGKAYGFVKGFEDREYYFHLEIVATYASSALRINDFVYFNLKSDGTIDEILRGLQIREGSIERQTKSGHLVVKDAQTQMTFLYRPSPSERAVMDVAIGKDVLFTPRFQQDRETKKTWFVCNINEFPNLEIGQPSAEHATSAG
ncbi:hypothetical protein ACC676_01140 [Rhizobium ruizarguesonis]